MPKLSKSVNRAMCFHCCCCSGIPRDCAIVWGLVCVMLCNVMLLALAESYRIIVMIITVILLTWLCLAKVMDGLCKRRKHHRIAALVPRVVNSFAWERKWEKTEAEEMVIYYFLVQRKIHCMVWNVVVQ